MDLLTRLAPLQLCADCDSIFTGEGCKHGKLPANPANACALCCLLVAAASHVQSLGFQPLRSYNVLFQRLIKSSDLERRTSRSPGKASPLGVTIQAADGEVIMQEGYTESSRKPLLGDERNNDEVFQYRTYAEPCRSAVFHTRLPISMEGKRRFTGNHERQHVDMMEADSAPVKQWIAQVARTCSQLHEVCRKPLSPAVSGSSGVTFPHPIRLLKLSVLNGQYIARLVQMDSDIPKYACVSHRWRGNKQWKTKKATIDDAFKDIPFGSIPKTFQDAAIVAQTLGLEHLWIDSISIIQDDHIDWEQQSRQMGLIFQSSSYALAAVDAFTEGDIDLGLLLARNEMPTKVTIKSSFQAQYDRILPPLASQPTSHGQDELDLTEFEEMSSAAWRKLAYELDHEYTSFEMSVEKSPWNSRGWIFQERLLSPRMLYFTKEQVFWECAAGILSQSDGLKDNSAKGSQAKRGKRRPSGTAETSVTNLHQLLRIQIYTPVRHSDEPWSYTWEEHRFLQAWWRITERYSMCALTFQKDRWFAIAGLCKILQDHYQAEVHAGVWTIGVGSGLLWHARNTYLCPFSDFSAPSWSWLNLDGPIGYAYDDKSYSGCIQKVFPLIRSHSFQIGPKIGTPEGLQHGFTGKLSLTCPTAWVNVSGTKFADFQFREMTGQTTAMPAWKYFETVSDGRCTVELAREYRSMGLPGMTRLLQSTVDEKKTNSPMKGDGLSELRPAIGWVVLDREDDTDGPVLCALLLRRDLYGAKDAQQQILECVLLVRDNGRLGSESVESESNYRRIGRGRIVVSGFLSSAEVDTISII